jgi:NAD-dependent SIR2 family protein deacetylase
MTDLHTDGNEVAGILDQVLTVEATLIERRCQSCGARQPLAVHRAYHGAGIVLRCPDCEDVAIRIAPQDGCLFVEWRGTYRIEMAEAAASG